MAQTYYAPPAPPRRRSRRWPWVLLVIVVVLAGLFVVADRIALGYAEDKAATSLQQSQQLNQKPDVTVDGFPFLTQLAAGEFDDVTISADRLEVTERAVSLTLKSGRVRLAVMLTDSPDSVLAELRAQGSSTLFPLVYAELRRVAQRYLSRERPGHTLQATALVHHQHALDHAREDGFHPGAIASQVAKPAAQLLNGLVHCPRDASHVVVAVVRRRAAQVAKRVAAGRVQHGRRAAMGLAGTDGRIDSHGHQHHEPSDKRREEELERRHPINPAEARPACSRTA